MMKKLQQFHQNIKKINNAKKFRDKIDRLDKQILELLNHRAKLLKVLQNINSHQLIKLYLDLKESHK